MTTGPLIFVVDDDAAVRITIRALLETSGYAVRDYPSATACLADDLSAGGCLISDIRMPRMDGMQFLETLATKGIFLPVVFITGHADVQLAVDAMKAGAADFIEKPFDAETMLRSLEKALAAGRQTRNRVAEAKAAGELLERLTAREKQVLDLLVAGQSHKVAARSLGISHRTVEIHRAHIMEKTGAKNLSDLVRIALAASPGDAPRTGAAA
jgi:two-component system response regulator FixJ